jgi:hypothetical protein
MLHALSILGSKLSHTLSACALQSHIWDDHEVFDGFNAQVPEVSSLKIYRALAKASERWFVLFQLHHSPDLPAPEKFIAPGDNSPCMLAALC